MTIRLFTLGLAVLTFALVAVETYGEDGPKKALPEVKLYLLTALVQDQVQSDGRVRQEVVIRKEPIKNSDPLLPNRFYFRWTPEYGWKTSFTTYDGRWVMHPSKNGGFVGGDLERVSMLPGDWLGDRREIHLRYDYDWIDKDDGKRVKKMKWSIANEPSVEVFLDFGFRGDLVTIYDPRLNPEVNR